MFFSFHYENDVWRASQVRYSWLTKPDREAAGFWDAASWEEVKRKGDAATKAWIDRELEGTSVTAVLIGAQTAAREYVQYEIIQSNKHGNGLLGVYIDGLRDRNSMPGQRGANPFSLIYAENNGVRTFFTSLYSTYDWVVSNGYDNFGSWVDAAARVVGR